MDSSADLLLQAAREALWACMYASMPLLIPILVVGLVIGVVQAATSVNEATLSFVPKLAVTALVLVVGRRDDSRRDGDLHSYHDRADRARRSLTCLRG